MCCEHGMLTLSQPMKILDRGWRARYRGPQYLRVQNRVAIDPWKVGILSIKQDTDDHIREKLPVEYCKMRRILN